MQQPCRNGFLCSILRCRYRVVPIVEIQYGNAARDRRGKHIVCLIFGVVHLRVEADLQFVLIARAGHAVQHDLVRTIMREVGGDAEGRAIKSRPRIVKGQRALSDGSRSQRIRRSKRDVDDAAVRREVESYGLALIFTPIRLKTEFLRWIIRVEERIGIPLRIPGRTV